MKRLYLGTLLWNAPRRALMSLVLFYRVVLSPIKFAVLGPASRCRFQPSCSEYALEALRAGGDAALCGGVPDEGPAGGQQRVNLMGAAHPDPCAFPHYSFAIASKSLRRWKPEFTKVWSATTIDDQLRWAMSSSSGSPVSNVRAGWVSCR